MSAHGEVRWTVALRDGRVKTRKDSNDKIPTGMVEVAADKVTILNTVAKSLPFSISGAPEGEDDELREAGLVASRCGQSPPPECG